MWCIASILAVNVFVAVSVAVFVCCCAGANPSTVCSVEAEVNLATDFLKMTENGGTSSSAGEALEALSVANADVQTFRSSLRHHATSSRPRTHSTRRSSTHPKAFGVRIVCLHPGQTNVWASINDISVLSREGYGLVPGREVELRNGKKVIKPTRLPRDWTADQLRCYVLRSFPKVLTFKYMRGKPNSTEMIPLPDHLKPSMFGQLVNRSKLYIVPTSVQVLCMFVIDMVHDMKLYID